MATPLPLFHFSDALCVWAYVADVRFGELEAHFPEEIALSYHFVSIYGDIHRRIERDGGGYEGYSKKIRAIAGRFAHVNVHEEVFVRNVPHSSMPAHLFLRAVGLLDEARDSAGLVHKALVHRALIAVRKAFFEETIDVSSSTELLAIAERMGLAVSEIEGHLRSGRAHAALAYDLELQKKYEVAVSPALVMNEGRQRLNGNVGYRVLEANVRELLRQPADEFSWC